MTRSLRTVCLVASMICALSAWADPTRILYTDPTDAVFGRDMFVRAIVFADASGQPVTGVTVTFTLGATTVSAITDDAGYASSFLTVATAPGSATIHLSFAGDAFHDAAALDVPVTIAPQPSTIFIFGDRALPAGYPKSVTAELVDAATGAPIPGRLLRFSIGSAIVDVLGDSSGIATTFIQVPSTTAPGSQSLSVTFAGDSSVLPSSATQSTFVYTPSQFVIWGGNAGGVHAGDHVVFLAPDWSKQVTGGDYQAAADFKGFVDSPTSLTEACGNAACWTAKPGDLHPPATQSPVIGVLVSTSITRNKGRISGNAPNIAIIAVDSSPTATRRSGTVLYIAVANQGGGD